MRWLSDCNSLGDIGVERGRQRAPPDEKRNDIGVGEKRLVAHR